MMKNALDTQFGFPGFVTSDWGGTHSTVAAANAGLDMQMPDASFFGTPLQTAVNNGQVSTATLNSAVSRILTELFTFGLMDNPQHAASTGATVTTTAHQTVARNIAEEGSVLLKNTGALPLNPTTVKSIAVIGTEATSPQTAGGGSAGVSSSGTITPLQGITSRAGAGITVQSQPGNTSSNIAAAVSLARSSSVAIVFASYFESEGSDIGNINLSGNSDTLISQVAAANPNTIVVLNTGSAVTMPWANSVKGIVENWYPGQTDGSAIAALLYGDVNFSGKLPVTFPQSLADVPASTPAQWPGQNGTVQYSEGVNVGYRFYDAQNKTPLFPFGFGLSYTNFGYANLTVGTPDANGNVAVGFDVTNTGSRAGAEVAQVYVAESPQNGEPPKNLRGFTRVSLNPGQTQHVAVTLDARSFQFWNNAWTNATGTNQILVGASSRDIRLTGQVQIGSSGHVISLRAHANNMIVTADNAGASPLIANRTAIGPWESFDEIDLGNGNIALRAHANGDIVTAENAGASALIANRTAIGPWETFALIHNGDGSVSFRAMANGNIVTAENAGSSPLIANRTAIGLWEEFDLIND
jgi:beta-glucosidase